jgi:hypothetical protein
MKAGGLCCLVKQNGFIFQVCGHYQPHIEKNMICETNTSKKGAPNVSRKMPPIEASRELKTLGTPH